MRDAADGVREEAVAFSAEGTAGCGTRPRDEEGAIRVATECADTGGWVDEGLYLSGSSALFRLSDDRR